MSPPAEQPPPEAGSSATAPQEPLILSIPAQAAGRRLDAWLAEALPEFSRSRIQALLKAGCITVDGASAAAHAKMAAGRTVRVAVPAPVSVELRPEAIPLHILYEDRDLLVVDKQPGLVVHPAAGHAAGTLVNALLHHCRDLGGIGGELRPGIVHRLDKDTSGAMVVAKNEPAMRGLVDQFKTGRVHKEYLALVRGLPHPVAGTIETAIGRDPHDRKRMSARPTSGRPAVTHYETIEVMGAFCALRVVIETGRTHQVRVHLAHIGHPVLGDTQYGLRNRLPKPPLPVPRQMLHARRIRFEHPISHVPISAEAPIPADMAALMTGLRGVSGGGPREALCD